MEKLLKSGLVVVPLFMAVSVEAEKKETPNVLIIQTDEHSFRTLGCYRNILAESGREVWGDGVVVETPNIDFLADNGAIANRCYASTPVSSPSRSSFVSGLYPQQTDVVTNNIPMREDIITFAEELHRTGYRTGYIGKWHLDGGEKPGWAPARKFGFEENRYMMNRGHYKKMVEQGDEISVDGKKMELTEENFATDFWINKTIDFIQRHKEDAFCCMVSLPDPHGPNIVRAPYDKMYEHFEFQKPTTRDKDKAELPEWSYGGGAMENMPRYFGMVKCIDDNVGRLLDYLRKENLLDNTIIVFTSDHGDMCGEHGLTNKGIPLEASAKIPFIVYYPEKINKGTVVNEALSVVDFAPTILSLVDVKSSVQHSGRDASALLMKGKAPKNWNDVIFMRGTSSPEESKKVAKGKACWVAAVTSRYKLVFSEVPTEKPWLLDLEKDPMELMNYYSDKEYSHIVKELTQEIKQYGDRHNDPRVKNEKIVQEMNSILSEF